MNGLVSCSTHGKQTKAYVCVHLMASLNDHQPRGLFVEIDDDGCPNGWCTDCENKLQAAGNRWSPELERAADISLICCSCFKELQKLNGVKVSLQ